MKTSYLSTVPALLVLSMFVSSTVLRADADDLAKETATFETDASAQGNAQVTDTLAGRFAVFAGSEDNAKSLVTGLRTGSEITLTTTTNGQTTTTTFTPSAGTQGYGNVFLSLSLAEHELSAQGITQPTAAEIQAALNGGSVTVGTGADAKTVQLTGVLALRASGEGWGQIAQHLGVKLGRVVSDLHAAHERLERTDPDRRLDQSASRPDHDAISDKVEKVERPEKIDRIERPERPELIERPERVERPERPEVLPHL